ncbi:MAG: histidine kinase [Sphingobacteriaceae bacterium]|nr:histidine kinase [Cytophagaceae bacterium]
MPYRAFRLLFLLLNLWPASLLAQQPAISFQHLTLRQGLISNYAMALTQDSAGFVWIGTANGLTRFDGLRCLTYTPQAGNRRSLSHRIVRCVYKAGNGVLWVGTQEGLNRFDPATNSFRRYALAHLGPDCGLIRNATETPDGTLWLATKGGLVAFDPVRGRGRRLPMPVDPAGAPVDAIRCVLAEGPRLWIGTEGGLFTYEPRTQRFGRFRHDDARPNSLPEDYVTALVRHPRRGGVLVGTREGHLAALDSATGHFRRLPLPPTGQAVSALLFTKNETLWVGVTGNGLHRYDPTKNRFLKYLNDENNPRSLVSNSVKALFEDRSGVVWVSTDDAGLSWFNPRVEKFHSLFDDVGYRPASTLGLDVARMALDRQQRLWAATRDGLVAIDLRTQTYRLYRHDSRDPHSLGNNFMYCALADRRGRVWVGSTTGLDRFDPATGHFEHLRCLPTAQNPDVPPFDPTRRDFVAGSRVNDLTETADGRILIGTDEKLTVYDPQTDTFAQQFNDERLRKLPGKNYNTLYLDRRQNLWVGGLGPVYKIDPALRLSAEYVSQVDDPHSLPSDGVTGFAEDTSGRFWMGTDNGLARLDERSGRFTTYTTRHGLPSSDLAALLRSGDRLWISSSNGLACLDTRRMRLTVFDDADGLPVTEFESGSVLRDSTGRIYFGGGRGLVYVQPGQIRLNRFVPPVYLTSFRVGARDVLAGSLPIVLNYTETSFTFEMAALSYDHPEGNRYAYRLEGFEEAWTDAGTRSSASYTNVPPGTYTLHVMAANADGVWNRQGVRLSVVIHPPFWATWWFRTLIVLGLAGAIWALARQREQRLLREQREKSELRERIATSEMQALRAQMNPHFIYNSLNAIRLFVLQNDSDNAEMYLVKFARLMRLILDNSRQEAVALGSEVDQLQLYLELEQLRFDHSFDFSIQTDPSLSRESTLVPPMIIQPFIENAILHGIAHKKAKGHITVTIQPVGQHLECSVDDDGVGRQRARELKSKTVRSHQSVGLRVTEDRLQLISQRSGKVARVEVIDKTDEQGAAAGTRVVIELPLITNETPNPPDWSQEGSARKNGRFTS